MRRRALKRLIEERLVEVILDNIPDKILDAQKTRVDGLADIMTDKLVRILNGVNRMADFVKLHQNEQPLQQHLDALPAAAANNPQAPAACCLGTCCIGNMTQPDCAAMGGTSRPGQLCGAIVCN
jgi:hypothetical protein